MAVDQWLSRVLIRNLQSFEFALWRGRTVPHVMPASKECVRRSLGLCGMWSHIESKERAGSDFYFTVNEDGHGWRRHFAAKRYALSVLSVKVGDKVQVHVQTLISRGEGLENSIDELSCQSRSLGSLPLYRSTNHVRNIGSEPPEDRVFWREIYLSFDIRASLWMFLLH